MSAPDQLVPHGHYVRVKLHLYHRIAVLQARAERAETALAALADQHHRTLTNSKLHDPENQDWRSCPCKTCQAAASVLDGVTHTDAPPARVEGGDDAD